MADNHSTRISTVKRSSSNTNTIKLEKITLKKFDGNIRHYPKFKEEFELYVKPTCIEDQLAIVLWFHLSKKVQNEIDCIDINRSDLWSLLNQKYGSKGKQIDAILGDVIKVMYGTSNNVLMLINVVETAYRDLARIGCQSEMHSVLFISMIERKLPKNIRFDWTKYAIENYDADGDVKFKQMLKLLRKWKAILENKISNHCIKAHSDISSRSSQACSRAEEASPSSHASYRAEKVSHKRQKAYSRRAEKANHSGQEVHSSQACSKG